MILEKGKRLLFTVADPEDVAVVPEIEGWSDVKPESVVDVTIPEGVSESDRRDILVKLEHHKYVFVRGVNKPEKAAPPKPAGWSTTTLIGCGLCCLIVGCSIQSWCIQLPVMNFSLFALIVCAAAAILFLNPKKLCERVLEIAAVEATVLFIAGTLNCTMPNEIIIGYGNLWGAGDGAYDNGPPPT